MKAVITLHTVTAAFVALLLAGCGRSASVTPGSGASATPATTGAASSRPSVEPSSSRVSPTTVATAASTNASGAAPSNSASGAPAPDPCSLLTVDQIRKAYNTPFLAGQRNDTVDQDGAKRHECTWQSSAPGTHVHLYLDVQTNADLAALPKDINTVDTFVRSTSHFIVAKPTQIAGLKGGAALRNGANGIDIVFPGLLLRVSGDSVPAVLPGLAAAAAARIATQGGQASAAATPAASSTSAQASSDCEPGGSLEKINGVTVQVFCGGTASAEATYNGQNMSWTGGKCDVVNNNKQLAVHVGTDLVVPSSIPPRMSRFRSNSITSSSSPRTSSKPPLARTRATETTRATCTSASRGP